LEVREDYEIFERRACRLLVLHRSVCRYESRKKGMTGRYGCG